MRRAAAIGMFDGVHLGHQALVAQLREYALERGLQPVAYTFDRHPLEIVSPQRAPRLLTTPQERCRLLVQAGADEAQVLTFDDDLRRLTAREFVAMMHERHGVDMILMGFNHRFGSDRVSDAETCRIIGQGIGVEVLTSSLVVETDGMVVSSSAVRAAIAGHDIERANAMLGREYSVTGTVAHGRAIGRTIGFPTANVVPDHVRQLLPANGAYACVAECLGGVYPAMVNVGHRPTVEGRTDAPLSVEAHIIGIDRDMYDERVTLRFVAYLRGERAFPSLEALRQQLEQDREETLKHTVSQCQHP